MTKVSVTFEADSWDDLYHQINQAAGKTPSPFSDDIAPPKLQPVGDIMNEEEIKAAAKIVEETAKVVFKPASAKSATKKRPEQVAPPPQTMPEPNIAPEFPVSVAQMEMPSLEDLKAAITIAVRAASKGNGSSRKILELLPGFKTKTGLDFVANATEEHRAELFLLTKLAGVNVGLSTV